MTDVNGEFLGLVVERDVVGSERIALRRIAHAELPPGDVLIEVAYSSLNYKDGLAVTGAGKIVRKFPLVPGVELAGTVVESASDAWSAGDRVMVMGWGVGERHWGGFAQFARVRSDWVEAVPEGFEPQHVMGIGVAGITAMQCVLVLEEHGIAKDAPVVVTGAGGGVGSVAVAILANLGYEVVASSGRPELRPYFERLGARDVIERSVLAAPSRPLESERWGGAIDNVGGSTLAGLLSAMKYGGTIAAVGLTGGAEFTTTVFPFILRGVNLLGIDSAMLPKERRELIWERLRGALRPDQIDAMTSVAPLGDVPRLAEDICAGKTRGRVVIDLKAT